MYVCNCKLYAYIFIYAQLWNTYRKLMLTIVPYENVPHTHKKLKSNKQVCTYSERSPLSNANAKTQFISIFSEKNTAMQIAVLNPSRSKQRRKFRMNFNRRFDLTNSCLLYNSILR